MAIYLVKARPKKDGLARLKYRLDSGEIKRMRPFGGELTYSLRRARIDDKGWVMWEEVDYCRPPLAQERAAVLDDHFTDISVIPVNEGQGWGQIGHLKLLWDEQRALMESLE